MNKNPFRPEIDDSACKVPDAFFDEIDIEFLIHELKDPIAVIETGVRSLLEKREKFGQLSPSQERTLKRALRNCVKARVMLYGLLEVGRSENKQVNRRRFKPVGTIQAVLLESLEATPGKIAESLSGFEDPADAMAFLATQGFDLDAADRAREAVAFQDELKFRQIAGNLIKNAIYHCKKRVRIHVDVDNDWLCLEVTDDGPGIEPEQHGFIFQRYTQISDGQNVTRKGHGLGLAGAYIIARHLGGDIKIKSEKGQGAAFCLYLPMHMQCTT